MADDQRKNAFADNEVDWVAILVNGAHIIRNSIGIIVICIVIGLLSGVFFYQSFPRLYEASMTVESEVLPAAEVESIINSWENLLEKNERTSLSDLLKLDVATVSAVRNIEVEDVQQVGEGAQSRVIFRVVARVTNVQILDSLQSAVISALENNPYVKKRVEIKKEGYELLQKKIYAEINELDSVRNAIKDLLEARMNLSGTILTDPANINVQLVNLYDRALQLERAIQLIDDFQVIQEFTSTVGPESPGLLIYLVSGLFAGIALAGLVIVLRIIAQKMKQKVIS